MRRVKFIFYQILLIPLTILFSNCHSNQSKYETSLNIYKEVNAPVVLALKPSSQIAMFSSLGSFDSLIFLDTTEVIGKIDKIQIEKGNIYIMDEGKAKGLFCFTMDGKLKWKYGLQGHGPGEFINLGDFQVRDDKIYLFDNIGFKILQLDTSGKMTTYFRTPKQAGFYPCNIYIDDNHKVVLYGMDMGDYKSFPYEMVVMDSACRQMQSFHFSKTQNPSVERWRFSESSIQPFNHNNGFYFTKAMTDTIYNFSSGAFGRKYAVDFGDYKIPSKMRRSQNFSLTDFFKSQYCGDIQQIFENDSLLTFRFQQGGNPNFVFLDKSTLQNKIYRTILVDFNKQFNTLNIIGSWNNKFIIAIEPLSLVQSYKLFAKQNPGKSDAELDAMLWKDAPVFNKMLHRVNMNSNPILLFLSISKKQIFDNAKK